MDQYTLIQKAFEAQKNAYAPYSKFHVGAALLTKSGEVILGANIENASYGLTCCAERNALFAAYSRGLRRDDLVSIAVVSDSDPAASPCGACRQVISELMPKNAPIYIANKLGQVYEVSVAQLLPFAFTKEQLK